MTQIASITFAIGTLVGEYPEGSKITDSILTHAKISAVSYGGQLYNKAFMWIHTGNTFETGNQLPSFVNGDFITFFFEQPIIIGCAN